MSQMKRSQPCMKVTRRSYDHRKGSACTWAGSGEDLTQQPLPKTTKPRTRETITLMGRNLKGKATKAGAGSQQKRRKKSGLGAGGSSPTLSATSSSGGTSTPGHRDCEQCGNNMLLEGVAKAWPVVKKSVASTGCQICDFVAFRRSQRPCVECTRTVCDHFCEWCGKGFHARCAKLRNEDVGNPNGFCCHKCESEQSEGHDTDEEETKGETNDEEDVGSRCGSCRLPFSTTGKDLEDAKVATGFKVNQAVLVDNDEVLYNALITEVDTSGERIKIHFTRWSKSFDDWYAMDDEHINESLACDCCNQWFHIGCLPPIKSSGRWKDSTYVCPRCIDDARAFHNGNRSVLKAKAAYISTSNAIAKASKRVTSPKESETASVTVAKTKKPSKAVVVIDDDDEDMEEVNNVEEAKDGDVRGVKLSIKRKRKLSEVADSPGKTQANVQSSSSAVNALSAFEKDPATASSSSRAAIASSEANGRTETNAEGKANVSKTPAVDANAAVCENASAMMHASPEHTIKVATEAHSSPSKATTAKIGTSNKAAVSEAKLEKPEKKQTLKIEATADHSNRHTSSNTVLSLLNSSPTNEATGFKSSVTSLPMLNPASNRNNTTASSKTSMAVSANFQVYVKMEQKNGRFPLQPRPMPSVKSVQPIRKEVAAPSTKSKPVARKTKQTQAGGRGLSAFDILREVASQEIDDTAGPVKPKREKRPPASRGGMNGFKRVKTDATCTSNASAAVSAGVAAHADSNQSPQTRERIQMNSFVDLHFSIRKEMYLRFCRLEEEGMLTRDSAHLLRSLIYPTSERFQDLKFVYLVNKDLPSVQLTKRLLEAVPYPPTVAKPIATTVPHATPAAIRSPIAGKGLTGLPMSMGMFSAAMNRNSSPAGASRIGMLPPPPGGSALLRPEPPRPDESSRLASGSASGSQSQPTRTSTGPVTKRPEMLIVEQLAPTHRPVTSQPQPQQQQPQRLLNSRMSRLPVSLIAACSVNRVIGKQGRLPWNLPADWAFFSTATQNQVLVVGRRSFEEFDEPIPNRHTIVVSSTLQKLQVDATNARWPSVQFARTLEQALQLANTDPQYRNCNRVFVGGGERLYKEAMDSEVADSCYVSRVHQYITDGDTFFPEWTEQFPNLTYSAKTNGGRSIRVSFEIWGTNTRQLLQL